MLHPDPFMNFMVWIWILALSILILMGFNNERILPKLPKWLIKIGYGCFFITVGLFLVGLLLGFVFLISFIVPILPGDFSWLIAAIVYIVGISLVYANGWFISEKLLQGKVRLALNPISDYIIFGVITFILILFGSPFIFAVIVRIAG